MKRFKFYFQLASITALMVLATFSSCSPEVEFIEEMEEIIEEEPAGDEDTGPITVCTTAGTNAVRETDIVKPANEGKSDDQR